MAQNFSGIFQFGNLNFDEFESQNHLEQTQENGPRKIEPATSQNESTEARETPFQTRSFKKKVQTIEISFEENILSQHQEAFKKAVQKYIESVLSQKDIGEKTFLNQELFPNEYTNLPSSSPLTQAINRSISYDQRIPFLQDLKHEDMLSKFLTMVCLNSLQEVGQQFAYLGMKIWEKYLQIRLSYDDQDELLKIGENFVNEHFDKLYYGSQISFLTLKKCAGLIQNQQRLVLDQKIKEQFKKFLIIFTNTCLLVIDGYFANPYYGQPEKTEISPKRLHSCFKKCQSNFSSFFENSSQNQSEEEDLEGSPYKKRKL